MTLIERATRNLDPMRNGHVARQLNEGENIFVDSISLVDRTEPLEPGLSIPLDLEITRNFTRITSTTIIIEVNGTQQDFQNIAFSDGQVSMTERAFITVPNTSTFTVHAYSEDDPEDGATAEFSTTGSGDDGGNGGGGGGGDIALSNYSAPSQVTSGDTATFNATITNNTNESLDGTNAEMYIGDEQSRNQNLDSETPITWGPGEAITLAASTAVLVGPGTYNVVFAVGGTIIATRLLEVLSSDGGGDGGGGNGDDGTNGGDGGTDPGVVPTLQLSNPNVVATPSGSGVRYNVNTDVSNTGGIDAKAWWMVAFLNGTEVEREAIAVFDAETNLPNTDTDVRFTPNPLDADDFSSYPANVEILVGYVETGSDATAGEILTHPDSHQTDSITVTINQDTGVPEITGGISSGLNEIEIGDILNPNYLIQSDQETTVDISVELSDGSTQEVHSRMGVLVSPGNPISDAFDLPTNTLTVGTTYTLELFVDGESLGTSQFTVIQQSFSDITVLDVSIPNEVEQGQDITATATLENAGNTTGDETFQVLVNGLEAGQLTFDDVPPGSVDRPFTITVPSDATTLTVTVGGITSNQASVIGQPAPSIEVSNLQASSSEPMQATVQFDIVNNGDAQGTADLRIFISGSTVDVTRTVDPGESIPINESFSGLQPGQHDVEVRDITTGQQLALTTVTVPQQSGTISIGSLSATPASVEQGQTVSVSLELDADGPATQRVHVIRSGGGTTTTLFDQELSMSQGDTFTDTIPVDTSELAFTSHAVQVEIDGSVAGSTSFEVTDPSGGDDGDDGGEGVPEDRQDFLLLLAALVIALIGLFSG